MSINKLCKISFIVFIAICALSITNLFAETNNSNNPTAETNISQVKTIDTTANINSKTEETSINKSADAVKKAMESKKYLFVLFYKDAIDEKYKKLEADVLKFKNSSTVEISIYSANISDTKESEAVSKYGLDRGAPMPLALVVAPNGAVVGGFNSDTPDSDYSKAIVSDLAMNIMKTVQERKIALVMLQNKQTKFNEESKKAANDSMSDPKIGSLMTTIEADPDKIENQEFLKQCKIEGKVLEATVVVVVPPAAIAGVLKGNITKDNILSTLVSSCGSGGGCGPGGCK
ncbi:MAG TPA: hypothetical protein PKK26_18680 [Candidatus Wallbacteria bacterium]|nr:hypothetical protein [Candidatus Wallbacteria bacterium]